MGFLLGCLRGQLNVKRLVWMFPWKVKYNNGVLMFSCYSGSAGSTSSSLFCL